MATEMSELCFPVDRVMGRKGFDAVHNAINRGMDCGPNHPEAAEMIFEFRDRSLDEADETLREESEYWHGMSIVGDDWFFQPEN